MSSDSTDDYFTFALANYQKGYGAVSINSGVSKLTEYPARSQNTVGS